MAAADDDEDVGALADDACCGSDENDAHDDDADDADAAHDDSGGERCDQIPPAGAAPVPRRFRSSADDGDCGCSAKQPPRNEVLHDDCPKK